MQSPVGIDRECRYQGKWTGTGAWFLTPVEDCHCNLVQFLGRPSKHNKHRISTLLAYLQERLARRIWQQHIGR